MHLSEIIFYENFSINIIGVNPGIGTSILQYNIKDY